MRYIIAEIGVNHNGSFELALKLIDEAAKIGVNAVKFQSYKAELLCSKTTPKVPYQERDDSSSHFEMLKKLEFSFEQQEKLFNYCKSKTVDFISTPYDTGSANFLKELGVKRFKTASADLIDFQLQSFIAKSGIENLMAIGMASEAEIKATLDIYSEHASVKPVLLHCVSSYPCSDSALNLMCIPELRDKYGLEIGFSDHSVGSQAAVIAVGLGCRVFEKHFTLSKTMSGPDHVASSEPDEFFELIRAIDRAQIMLGNKRKETRGEEKDMKLYSRKSIYAAKNLYPGHIINEGDLICRRPGTGMSPMQLPALLGSKVLKKINKDDPLIQSNVEVTSK